MASTVLKKFLVMTRTNALNKMMSTSIYEPDYLEAIKPKYPLYPTLTVAIRGYDYPILEHYQSWISKIADVMDFDVEDSYAIPAKELKVSRFKPQSTNLDAEYFLRIYQRNLKVSNVPSIRLPIFIKILEAALPEGVMLDIEEFSAEKDKIRFVPDKYLLDLKAELEEMKKK